jgi:uncharacterized repeat protein (TIGR03803 family)
MWLGGLQNHPVGTLTTVHSFDYTRDGAHPFDGPLRATDGKFYGTTPNGGAGGAGTTFGMTPSGKFSAKRKLGDVLFQPPRDLSITDLLSHQQPHRFD